MLATTIVVRKTDAPGFSSTIDRSPDEPTPAECVLLRYDPDLSDLVRTGKIFEPSLSKPQPSSASPLAALEVDQDVDVMSTAADAGAAFTRQVSPKVPHCVASILAAASTDKAQFKLHAIHAVTPAGATQLKAGWRIEIRVQLVGLPATAYVPYIVELSIRAHGRAITDLLVTGSDKESGNVAALHRHLQRLVAARLKTAFP